MQTPVMVTIPAGTVSLRDDRTKEKWIAEVAPFLLATTPVSQSLYADVTGDFPSTRKDALCPVETVSWFDAARFCNRLSELEHLDAAYEFGYDDKVELVEGSHGYRLPNEAEWQYACQAGSNEPRYGELDDIAWYAENSEGATHPAGQKAPNAWGLHDMLGNVWEWCSDIYDPEVYGSYRVFRGGGWADKERGCLATNRRRSHPTYAIDDLGFRVARTA